MRRSVKILGGLTRGRKAVKNLQMWTLHNCIEVGQVMQNLTLTKKQTSEQYVELSTSRSNRDFEDLMVFQLWIKKFSKWFDLER